MKRALVFVLFAAGLIGASWAYRAVAPPEPELWKYVPSGALLYLQAKDFNSLLSDWDKSAERADWLKSSNYEVFSRSRLFLRLKDAEGEFSSVAGVPADVNLLHQVAGQQSTLTLYDIGKLQFLYITRLPSAASMQSALWQTRAKFETRSAGGVTFYYRQDPNSDREVAFAVTGDYLLLATREDLMAGALQLLAGPGAKDHSLEQEQWWSRSVSAAGEPGELRMVLNLEKIVPSPYFRSYWIQQNITDMKQYSAAICDLTRSGNEYLEQRTLWKKDAAAQAQPDTKGAAAVADLLRLVPASDTGIYEAKAQPDPKESLGLLETKILAPHLGPVATTKIAPAVQLGNGETGSTSDLETRIDQPPVQNPATESDGSAALKDLLAKNHVLAQVQLQGTERDPAGVFVRIHSAIVFLAESDWNEAAAQAALVQFVRPAFTTSQLGIEWKSAQQGYSQLDGLWTLTLAVRGKYLFISDHPALLISVLANMNQKSTASAALFAAGFNHHRERQNFTALTKLLDRGEQSSANGQQPEFFSGNIATLSAMFKDISSETVVVRDALDRQTQTVSYIWTR